MNELRPGPGVRPAPQAGPLLQGGRPKAGWALSRTGPDAKQLVDTLDTQLSKSG